MFDIADTKVFMDSVHGYISVPKCFVKHLIDTEAFQRLRNIDQTGMKILYPDAKHDRFGHSLGVYHLGCKAVDALLQNFSHDDYWNISSDYKKVIFWAKNKILFLIACLLHDIGHAPFSHALEKLMLENSVKDQTSFTEQLVSKLNEKEHQNEKIEPGDLKAAPHEEIGAMFVIEQMEEQIRAIFNDLHKMPYPSISSDNILFAEHYHYNPVINDKDLDNDICFIARMILGLKYRGYEPEKQIRNCFIELLNGNFDVDKLDYIIRDTKMSGISNISIDIERLLNSVIIVTKTRFINHTFQQKKFSNRTIYSLKNTDTNCLEICGTFRGTIRLENGAHVHIKQNSCFLSLSTPTHGIKICYEPGADTALFSIGTEIIKNGQSLTRKTTIDKTNYKVLHAEDEEFFECNINKASVLSPTGFSFFTHANREVAFYELEINGFCDIKITGNCSIKSSCTLFNDTSLSGTLQEIVFMGNLIQKTIPTSTVYNEFSVGFKKQAINIIANVLEARDYLYLWIYAHHKVIYYANFLIPILASQIFIKENNKLPSWHINYANIKQIDDAYIWTAIKCKEWDGELNCLCNELLSRNYKRSLYKSLAEYDILFESFTIEQRLEIRNYLVENIRQDRPCLLESGNISAGYLSEQLLQELQKYGAEDIVSLVFVDASYRSKKNNPHDTLIVMGDEIVSIDRIPLLSKNMATPETTAHYVYFYFSTNNISEKYDKVVADKLKSALKELFKKHVNNKQYIANE